MELTLGADVNALGGLVEQKRKGRLAQPLPKEDLLLVATAEAVEPLPSAIDWAHIEATEPSFRLLPLLPGRKEPAVPELLHVEDRHVVLRIEGREAPRDLAVWGHEPDAKTDGEVG